MDDLAGWPCIYQARIRMGCSKLNQHLFHNHLIENSSYATSHPVEDPTHFFLNFPRYAAIRIELVNTVALITTAVLLYGNTELDIDKNKCIFGKVHKFIVLTCRFE